MTRLTKDQAYIGLLSYYDMADKRAVIKNAGQAAALDKSDLATPAERFAIAYVDFHSQVCNGGLTQWLHNCQPCEQDVDFLRRHLSRMSAMSAPAKEALTILDEVKRSQNLNGWQEPEDEEALDGLDTRYYAISDALTVDAAYYAASLS